MREIAISIATTGHEASTGHRIIEIGCLEILDGEVTDNHWHFYLNPERQVDQIAFADHGISNESLLDKPTFADVSEDFLSYIGNDKFIVFNASLVLSFLHYELSMLSGEFKFERLDNDFTDILELGKQKHPSQSFSFTSLCQRYYIDASYKNVHGALLRSRLIVELLEALNNNTSNKVISNPNKYVLGNNLVIVKSFSQFDDAMEGISKTALCRGVSDHEYALLPSLFRHHRIDDTDTRESNLMWVFKTHAKAHLEKTPQSELEWLVIAQHHGLPTRLLDWSLNPLVACFFAVQTLSNKDGAVYIYNIGRFSKEEEVALQELDEIVALFPSHVTKRVTAQSGMFTVHPTKKMKLESNSIKKILIPAKYKKVILEKLVKYGIHQGTMFPDLDGLSSYIRHLNEYSKD